MRKPTEAHLKPYLCDDPGRSPAYITPSLSENCSENYEAGGGVVAPIPAKGRPSDVFIRHVVYLSILPPSQILREVKAPYSSSMQCSLSE